MRQALRSRPSVHDLPALGKGVGIAVLIGRLFFDSYFACALFLCLVPVYLVTQRTRRQEERQKTLARQFQDVIVSAAGSMKAGLSAENAFLEAAGDMALLYGEGAPVCEEMVRIRHGLKNKRPLEALLSDLASRSKEPDLCAFADVFAVAKRGGGNLTRVFSDAARLIGGKMDAEKEIDVLVSGKRTEAAMMKAAPAGILLYIRLTSPGYFTPLYHNLTGILFMSAALLCYVFACRMIDRIVRIEV